MVELEFVIALYNQPELSIWRELQLSGCLTSADCLLHRKRAELVREGGEKPGEPSSAKRKKRESPRKKGAQAKKQESSGSESGSDVDSPELSMAHSEV